MSSNATSERDIERQNNTPFAESLKKCALRVRLVMSRGRRVRVIAEGVGIPFGEDFHQPAIKVIDWVIHDWFEAAGVFSVSLFHVGFQSYSECPVLAA